VAVFDGTVDNNPVETGTGGYTLGGLQIKNGFTQYLKMKGPLVLTGDSQMTSSADIWSDRATATLTQQAGTFTWSSGRINTYTGAVKSSFNVGGLQGGTLLVNNTATVTLGSDLRPAAGGTVLLQNTGTLKLANQATIINNGSIQISVDNNAGIAKNKATDATVTITNGIGGTIWKLAGTATYQIDEPVLNQNGTIQVDAAAGRLSFDGATADTRNTSLYQTGGGIQLAGTATINAGSGLQIDGGTVLCVGQGFSCTLSGQGDFTMNGGTVLDGSTDDPGDYGTLTLDVPNVNWNGGNFSFTYDVNSSTASNVALTDPIGNMTIGRTGPSLNLTLLGSGSAPNSIDLFVSTNGTITDRSDPAPLGWTGAVTGAGQKYTITQGPSALGGSGGLALAGRVTAPGAAATDEALAADLYFACAHHKRYLPDDLGPTAA
jgi:hypothetical protein